MRLREYKHRKYDRSMLATAVTHIHVHSNLAQWNTRGGIGRFVKVFAHKSPFHPVRRVKKGEYIDTGANDFEARIRGKFRFQFDALELRSAKGGTDVVTDHFLITLGAETRYEDVSWPGGSYA